MGRIARTAADGVGAREWLEMGGEKKPLEISELGCADGCGRCGSRQWLEMGGEKKPLEMSGLGCAGRCGRRGCKGVAGNGWGEEAAGMSELGCADGCGRHGCKRVVGNGWGKEDGQKWVGRRRRWRSASLPGPARTTADGVGARSGWTCWEKKPLG